MRHSSRPIRGTREIEERVVLVVVVHHDVVMYPPFSPVFSSPWLTTFGSLCQHPRRSLPMIGRHKSRTRRKKRLFRARPFERGGSQKDAAERERRGREKSESERRSERERGCRVDDVCFAVVDISVLSVSTHLQPPLDFFLSIVRYPSSIVLLSILRSRQHFPRTISTKFSFFFSFSSTDARQSYRDRTSMKKREVERNGKGGNDYGSG